MNKLDTWIDDVLLQSAYLFLNKSVVEMSPVSAALANEGHFLMSAIVDL